jgi:hypothetical protein
MWTIKSNYQINFKDLMILTRNNINESVNDFNLKSNSINAGNNRFQSKIANCSYLNDEIKSKITRNLEQKASMINSNVILKFVLMSTIKKMLYFSE